MSPSCPSLQRLALVVLLLSFGGFDARAEGDESALFSRSLVNKGDTSRLERALAKARRGETIVVGVICGSITQGAAASQPEKRYGNLVAAWWRQTFPKTRVQFINAGIGATGSDYGALRVQRDLLSQHPDFFVVEYAVNDPNTQAAAETLEGLVRQILGQTNQPAVVLLFTMNRDGSNAQEWHSKVGRHYELPMVSFRDALWPEIKEGRLKWSDVEADVVHPNDRGHDYCARLVTRVPEQVLAAMPADANPSKNKALPEPLFSDRFEHVALYEADALKPVTNQGWTCETGQPRDNYWKADRPGSVIEFEIVGQVVLLMDWHIRGPMGQASVRVDDRPSVVRDGWFDQTWGGYRQTTVLARDLGPGKHRVKIELLPEKNAESSGHEFRILGLGAAGIQTSQVGGPQAQNEGIRKADPAIGKFAQPWHLRHPHPIMTAAWERLKQLEIPGVPLDQHFQLQGQKLFVSPDGNDTADGSRDHPWKTLRHAVGQLSPGTVIYLIAGTYYGPIEIRTKATEPSPAALRALAGQEVVVTYDEDFVRQQQARISSLAREGAVGADGKELHYPSLITVGGTYVEISGLHLLGVRDRLPMNLYSENGISIAGGGGLGCRVLDNEVENTGHCGIKEMGHGGRGFLVEGNYIHDVGLTAHDHAIYLPADDVTVRRNLLLNAAGWGVHAYSQPKRLVISHNLIGGNAQDAVILAGSDCRVFNNIFYHDKAGGVFLFRRACRNNTVVQNIILEPAAFRFDSAGSDATADQPQGNTLDYNCIVSASSTGSRLNPLGTHNIHLEPGFVDAARLDFRLLPASPCIDAGDPKSPGKYCGQAPDIGLYETR